jgi:hypothetical protein
MGIYRDMDCMKTDENLMTLMYSVKGPGPLHHAVTTTQKTIVQTSNTVGTCCISHGWDSFSGSSPILPTARRQS